VRKVRAVAAHFMKAYVGSRIIAPTILFLGTNGSDQIHASLLYQEEIFP